MIEAQQFEPGLAGALFGNPVIIRPHEESAPRSFFGRVRQRVGFTNDARCAEQGAATFMGERFAAMSTNRGVAPT